MDNAEKLRTLRDMLESLGTDPSGPTYAGVHKQLGELLLNDNEEEAAFHLCESHVPTLRSQACHRLKQTIKKLKENTAPFQDMMDRLMFISKWQDGFSGLQKRLSELPSGWTVVQVTSEWDPLSRFLPRNKDINRGLGAYITRLSLGEPSTVTHMEGKSMRPVTVFLPALDENEERVSLPTAMRKSLALLDSSRGSHVRHSKCHEECSKGIEATLMDIEKWIGGWHFLFNGCLMNENVNKSIKAAVDSHIATYFANDEAPTGPSEGRKDKCQKSQLMTDKEMNFLYLMASCPSMNLSQIQTVLLSILKDTNLALDLSVEVYSVIQNNTHTLSTSKRHPVVLVIDEDLDILPFETVPVLKNQSFSRCPSIHFLHGLYTRHHNTTMRNGINAQNGFYIINPTKDLPQLNKLFASLTSNPIFQKWKGQFQVIPSKEEVVDAFEKIDIFLYCGHGGGNQFVPKECIEKSLVRSLVMLFGCSSSKLSEVGGRVEMTSLAYSYLISGSPCVVGMNWNVLDKDINAMTEELVYSICDQKYFEGEKEKVDVDTVIEDFTNLEINSKEKPKIDLCKAVCVARRQAAHVFNKAAIVVRGLPIKIVFE